MTEPGHYLMYTKECALIRAKKSGNSWLAYRLEHISSPDAGRPGDTISLMFAWDAEKGDLAGGWMGRGKWREFLDALGIPPGGTLDTDELLNKVLMVETGAGKNGKLFVQKTWRASLPQQQQLVDYLEAYYPEG